MKRELFIILLISTLITTGDVGGAYYANVPAGTCSYSIDTIIKCNDQDLQEKKDYRNPVQLAANNRSDQKPDLRRKAKEPPKGIAAECRFPAGDAAELERKMSVKDDPRDSMWIDDYCHRRKEIARLHCELPDNFFYHSYNQLCSGRR